MSTDNNDNITSPNGASIVSPHSKDFDLSIASKDLAPTVKTNKKKYSKPTIAMIGHLGKITLTYTSGGLE